MGSWQNGNLTKQQADKMASWWNMAIWEARNWWNGKLMKCGSTTTLKIDEIKSWLKGRLIKWDFDKMASCLNGKFA